MERIRIETEKSYEVIVGRGILEDCGQHILQIFGRGQCPYQKVAVIADDLAGAIYGRKVLKGLREVGLEAKLFTFPHGENSKNNRVLNRIYEFLVNFGLTRTDLIVALGGGVCGDMAGFAAATCMRGVDYVQIPTTLIAQTDSSVGGKTAINSPFGKNLIGAFHQPRLVICDIQTLSTLPGHIFNEGMGEVVKYALISGVSLCQASEFSDLDLMTLLEQADTERYLDRIVSNCIKIKADIIRKDEFEQGDRMLLNLGHTVGHAVELASGYTVRHGNAVAIGTSAVVKSCVRQGLLSTEVEQRFHELLKRFHLPASYRGKSMTELAKLASVDKKRDDQGIQVVLCHGVGDCRIRHMTMEEWDRFLTA